MTMAKVVGQRTSGTATRTSNLKSGTCRWYSDGYLLYVFLDDVVSDTDINDNGDYSKPLFTGLPNTKEWPPTSIPSLSDSRGTRLTCKNGNVYVCYFSIKANKYYGGLLIQPLV